MPTELALIDAFIDGEPVDPTAVKAALATPEGRDHLVDALLLREVLAEDADAIPIPSNRGTALRWLAAAAALVLAATGGYLTGIERGESNTTHVSAPAPSQVVEVTPGVNWFETPGGTSR